MDKKNNPFIDILKLAVEEKASDIFIKTGALVALRLHGKITETNYKATQENIRLFLEVFFTKENYDSLLETGDVDLSYSEDGIGRFRVNVHKQRGQIGITMRLVNAVVPNVQSLNLPPSLDKLINLNRGIVFITGTTGSGKSTTLAAIIDGINKTQKKHIITIEDPIEYEFIDKECFIEQREVGIDTTSFDSAFIHSLRQNPDIIVLGEMRSKDSFDAALKSAETGHLVFSTLHTKNASQSIERILDFYESSEHPSIRESLASSLAAVVSQRLVPNKGKESLIPAVEIMINTPIVQLLLRENKIDQLQKVIEGSREEGMQSFNQSLLDLVNSGKVDKETALKFSDNQESLKMNFSGVFIKEDGAILS